MTATRGLALVLTVGVLVLLSVFAVGVLRLTEQIGRQSSLRLDRTHADLLARSGIEYASARLFEDPATPGTPTSGNQADDWTFRDGDAPLEKARNPSYARTEPYRESGTPDGRYDAGVDRFDDLDSNGLFDSWSGRMRGNPGPYGGTFALRISGNGGKLGVNDGLTGTTDLNGNGTPDHADVGTVQGDLFENRRIAELLTSLMESLSQPLLPTASAPTIGERIVLARPPGGYRTLEQVRDRAGISAADWRLLRRHLTLETGGIVQGVRPVRRSPVRAVAGSTTQQSWLIHPDRRRPIRLAATDEPILRALFRRLFVPPHPLRRDERGGTWGSCAQIDETDARILADFFLSFRPFKSWQELFVALDGGKGRLVSPQQAALAGLTGAFTSNGGVMTPEQVRNQVVDLVFANANPDSLEVRNAILQMGNEFAGAVHGLSIPPLSWTSYDVDRPSHPWKPSRMERSLRKCNLSLSAPPSPFGWIAASWVGTQELSLAHSEDRFSIESLGRSADRLGTFRSSRLLDSGLGISETISARTQDEFENSGAGRIWNLPPGVSLSGRPIKDRMQTYPMFPRGSCPNLETHPDYEQGSPYSGDLRLMDYSPDDSWQASFHAPMWEEGQPFRNPARAGGWAENFQDRIGKARVSLGVDIFESDMALYSPKDRPENWAIRSLLESGSAAYSYLGPPVNPFADSGSTVTGPTFPGSLFPMGRYSWGPGASNPGIFPMVADDGTLRTGTLELWSAESQGQQLNPLQVRIEMYERVRWLQFYKVDLSGERFSPVAETVSGPGFYDQPDWHHVAVAFADDRVSIFVDGVWAGGGTFHPGAVDETRLQEWFPKARSSRLIAAGPQDEIRFYRHALGESEVRAHAQQPRFWTRLPELNPASLSGIVPSFTSALYRFEHPVRLTELRWDGFVPTLVAAAADAGNAPAPLRVELLCYDMPESAGGAPPRWIVPFPEEFWRTGGGGIGFDAMCERAGVGIKSPRIAAFRYRVWMDVSSVEGFNNETPVFDSISIGYRSRSALLPVSGK